MTAQEQLWTDLLAALAHERGIVAHPQPEPEGLVTATFQDVPVERALRRLVGRDAQYDFGSKASRAEAVPVGLWVWRQSTRPARDPSVRAAVAARDRR